MKVKELIGSLRIPVPIEFRINNRIYGGCMSDDRLAADLGDCDVEEWFAFSSKHSICIGIKEKDLPHIKGR